MFETFETTILLINNKDQNPMCKTLPFMWIEHNEHRLKQIATVLIAGNIISFSGDKFEREKLCLCEYHNYSLSHAFSPFTSCFCLSFDPILCI